MSMPSILGLFTKEEDALKEIQKSKITDNNLFHYGITSEFLDYRVTKEIGRRLWIPYSYSKY